LHRKGRNERNAKTIRNRIISIATGKGCVCLSVVGGRSISGDLSTTSAKGVSVVGHGDGMSLAVVTYLDPKVGTLDRGAGSPLCNANRFTRFSQHVACMITGPQGGKNESFQLGASLGERGGKKMFFIC
jgi:hypothetical protein